MAHVRRMTMVGCGVAALGVVLTGCSGDATTASSADLSRASALASTDSANSASAGDGKPLTLSKADEKLLQDALGTPDEVQDSEVGTVKPGQDATMDNHSAKPGRYTVNVTCGLGVGKLEVSIAPQGAKGPTTTRTVDCAGDRAVLATSVYTGTFATTRSLEVTNTGANTVAYGIAIVAKAASAAS